MNDTIRIGDFKLGKSDAKNELIRGSEEEKQLFNDSYYIPDNLNIQSFINGDKFYILGLKGTGKTALLRYVDLTNQNKDNVYSSFVLFKSDFNEDDRTAFARAANAFVIDKTDIAEASDYVRIWEWYIHSQIVRVAEETGAHLFNEDNNWIAYRNCVLSPVAADNAGKRFLPKPKRGTIELSAEFAVFSAKAGLEFDWENFEAKSVKLPTFINTITKLFRQLMRGRDEFYLFFDELEISLSKTKKSYEKDIRLVRDLILAIYNINEISLKKNYGVRIISAVRSEVMAAIRSTGKEINKCVYDFGVTLKWQLAGGNMDVHPLISVINKRIQACEKNLGLEPTKDDEIWKKYFPSRIKEVSPQEFILRKTWYRPRDVVRILSVAQNNNPNEPMFSERVFDSSSKEYSKQCWIEQAEELGSIYTHDEIDGIEQMFKGIECPFTFAQLEDYCTQVRRFSHNLDTLLRNHELGEILSHLYDLGIIGNTGQRVRFAFRGDEGLLHTHPMKVHDSLWNHFSITVRQ